MYSNRFNSFPCAIRDTNYQVYFQKSIFLNGNFVGVEHYFDVVSVVDAQRRVA